jgi:hypothetical protein
VRLARAKEQLEIGRRLQNGMKIALSLRSNKITELNGKIEQLREQNKRLDAEAERLADMVRFAPPADVAMTAK